MQFHELKTTKKQSRKRVGRGISAGQGKTAGRGTKGQNSRSGGGVRPGFEGGQNPLMQRVPKKKGFLSRRAPAQVIYTGQLNGIVGKTIDNALLADKGLIDDQYHPVKVVLKGEVTAKVTIAVARATKGSVAMIEKAGGTFTETAVPMRQAQKAKAVAK